jgi:hypothetical protein
MCNRLPTRLRRLLLYVIAALLLGITGLSAGLATQSYAATRGVALAGSTKRSESAGLALTPALDVGPATPAFCQGVYRGDTTGGDQRIDSYPCRPDWPETGPEHFYQLHTTASQPLTLTLSHPPLSGVDLNLFLFVNGDFEQCYYGNSSLDIQSLPPGDHLIVVDGFNGSEGPYTLQVSCSQTPFATSTPTDTPPPTATPTPTVRPTSTSTPTFTPTHVPVAQFSFFPSALRGHPQPTPQPKTLTLQPSDNGYKGLADSYINAWEISANYANVDRLLLRQPDIMSPILRFELVGLPANAHIVEATLSLWALSQSNDNPAVVDLYQLNRAWTPSQVTWQLAAQGTAWGTPGANAVPSDRYGLPHSQQVVGDVGIWQTWDVTSLVQSWLFDPATNRGVLLKAQAEAKVQWAFASAEYNDSGARPKLTIRYWTPSP